MTMPSPPALTADGVVADVAGRILQAVIDAFSDASIDLPARRYVAPGLVVAYDCEQLTVALQAVGTGIPGFRANRPVVNCSPTRMASYRVELVRCTPTVTQSGAAPAAAALNASGLAFMRDLDVMEHALRAAAASIAGPGEPVFISTAQPVTAEGGLAASLIDMDVPLGWVSASL